MWKYIKEFFGYYEYDIISQEYRDRNGYKTYRLIEFINLYKRSKILEKCHYSTIPLYVNFSIRKESYEDGCYYYEIYNYGPDFYWYNYEHEHFANMCYNMILGTKMKPKTINNLYISIKEEIMDHYIEGCNCF